MKVNLSRKKLVRQTAGTQASMSAEVGGGEKDPVSF